MNLQTAKEIERELAKKALCYWLPSDWKNALLIHEMFGLNTFRLDKGVSQLSKGQRMIIDLEMGGE
jgi:hypothetical protein